MVRWRQHPDRPTEAVLLVGSINEGLQDVIRFLSRAPAFLNHFEEDVLDLSVSFVPLPKNKRPGECQQCLPFCGIPSCVHICCFPLPEAGQRQPAGEEPSSVAESSIQICVELSHSLI